MADFFSSLLQGAPQIGEGISQGILGGTQALVSLQQADATRQIAQEQADTQRQQVENDNPIRLHAIDVASALAQSLPQYDAYLRASPQFGDGRGGLNPQGQHLLDMRHRQLSAYGQMAQTGDAGALLNILDQIDPATGIPKDPLAPTPPAPGADTSPSLGTPSSFTPAQLPQVGAALGAAGQFLPFGVGLSLAGQSLTAPPPPAAPASPAIPAPGSPDYVGYAARGAQSTPGQAAAAVPIPPITPTPTPDLGTRLFQQGNLPGALTQPPQMAPGTPPNPWASVPGPPAPTPAPPTAPLPRAGEPGFVGPVQPPATLAAPLPPTPSPGLPANGAAPHAPPGFGAVPAADASGPTYNMPGGVQITPGANGVPQVAAPGFAPVAVPTYNEIMSRVGALPTVQGAVQRRDQWQRMVDSYTQTGTPVPPDLLTAYDDANKEYDAAVKDGIGVVTAALKLPSEVNTAVAGAYASLATGANQQETATVAGAKLNPELGLIGAQTGQAGATAAHEQAAANEITQKTPAEVQQLLDQNKELLARAGLSTAQARQAVAAALKTDADRLNIPVANRQAWYEAHIKAEVAKAQRTQANADWNNSQNTLTLDHVKRIDPALADAYTGMWGSSSSREGVTLPGVGRMLGSESGQSFDTQKAWTVIKRAEAYPKDPQIQAMRETALEGLRAASASVSNGQGDSVNGPAPSELSWIGRDLYAQGHTPAEYAGKNNPSAQRALQAMKAWTNFYGTMQGGARFRDPTAFATSNSIGINAQNIFGVGGGTAAGGNLGAHLRGGK